jgi:hypothetical protein
MPYVRTKLALELEETIATRAKGNQVRKPADSVLQKSAEQKPIDTRAELATIAGVSHDTVAKVKKIEAKAAPEVKAKLASGEISINQAHLQYRGGFTANLANESPSPSYPAPDLTFAKHSRNLLTNARHPTIYLRHLQSLWNQSAEFLR